MIDFDQKNVVLGPLDYAGRNVVRGWRDNYGIWRMCRQNDLLNFISHEKWFDGALLGSPHNKMYSIVLNHTGVAIGVCGLTNIDITNRNGEFSLYIAPEYQKMGYGKEALLTLISHGFYNLNLVNIWGESFDFNPARELFKSIGMVEEGRRRSFYYKEGKYVDAYLYGILRHEWEVSDVFKDARVQKCST